MSHRPPQADYAVPPGTGPAINDGLGFLDNPLVWGGALASLLVISGLCTMMVAAVPPLTVGIKYNAFNKVADTSTIYEPGRYFVGPFNSFLYFPSDVRTIEFASEPRLARAGVRYDPLYTRTAEGLGLNLQVSLQYRLDKSKIGQLYNEFNQNYEQVFISAVRDTLVKAASQYDAGQLWTKRKEVGDGMQSLVDKALRRTYAECWGLQLMVIDLPDPFEKSIVQTQMQKQLMLTREMEQSVERIKAQTSVIKADFDRQVKVTLAQGKANKTVVEKEAQAQAQRLQIYIEATILSTAKKVLGLSQEELVDYQRYSAFDEMENASFYFGFSGSSQILMKR